MEKVSIIIPIFNTYNYLEECIESVIKQSYTNIEIILVNDGSTDNSAFLCEKYVKLDDRIHYYSKKNGGLSDARNYGIKRATGDYLFFLDSDDLIQYNTIEIMINTMSRNKGIVLCCFERFTDDYNDIKRFKIKKFNPCSFFEDILKLNSSTYACGVLIPKEFLNENFFIKNRYYEDLSSMYYIYSKCNVIYKISAGLYKYRINPNSIVHTSNRRKVDDYIKSVDEMIDFIKDNYNISRSIIETYRCEVLRSCYIMSGDEEYLNQAKELLGNVSFKKLSLKNKIKIFLLHSKKLTKLIIKLKNS